MVNRGLALQVDGVSTPPANTPVVSGIILYRDGFSGGNTANIVGRQTEAADAKAQAIWVGTDNGFAIQSGKMVKGSLAATSSALLPTTAVNTAVTIKLDKRPTVSGIYLDIVRGSITGAPPSYRLEITATTCRIMKRFSGSNTYLSPSVTIAEGSIISLRLIENEVSVVVDGIVRAAAIDTDIVSGNYAGIASTGTVTGVEIDWLQVEIF